MFGFPDVDHRTRDVYLGHFQPQERNSVERISCIHKLDQVDYNLSFQGKQGGLYRHSDLCALCAL
jgi:hypothetical protein